MNQQLELDRFHSKDDETVRLKHLARVNPTKSEVSDLPPETEVSFVPLEDFGTDGQIHDSEVRSLEDVYSGYTYFRDGDIAIAKITPSFENEKGAICRNLKNGIGFGTTELHILRPREDIDVEFLWYVLRSKMFMDKAEASMRGVAGQQRVPKEFIENFPVSKEILQKQDQIVHTLNYNLSYIGELISQKNKLVNEIRERQHSLISRAVVNGISNHEHKKPCDIPGIDEIPSSWETRKIKYCCTRIVDAVNNTAPTVDDGYGYMIRTSEIRDGYIDLDEADQVDKETFDEWNRRETPQSGDVVFTREAPVGEAGIIPEGKRITLGQRMMLFRADQSILNNYYLLYWFYSEMANHQYLLNSNGSTVDHLRVPTVPNLKITLPPLPEQEEIVTEIRSERERIRKLQRQLNRLTDLLNKKKTALITKAVSGDINEEKINDQSGEVML